MRLVLNKEDVIRMFIKFTEHDIRLKTIIMFAC